VSAPTPSPTSPPTGADAVLAPGGPITRLLAELGALAFLALGAARAVVRPRRPAPRLVPAVTRILDDLLVRGLPLVALIGVSLGAFLTMQAYFSATFRDAAGAVVGVGLLRNLAPLVTGFVLAGMLAGRIVPELRRPSRVGLDDDPRRVPDRDVARGRRPDDRVEPEPARLAAARIAAAAIAGPILAVWLAAAGLAMGMLVALSKLGVAPGAFANTLLAILEPRDVAGLLVKAALFGAVGALFACREGLREDAPRDPARDAWRAVLLATLAVMLINNLWFSLNYLAGSPYGPPLAVR
jgi:phospholipid/cholesterol/gamma-HCH transport system permease protein